MNDEKVAVLIVTYGERSTLLKRVLDRLCDLSCDCIIVVDNGVYGTSIDYLNDLEKRDRFVVLRNYKNLGSAGGIAKGIQYFLTLEIDYLWILDDDNVPDTRALINLRQSLRKINPNVDALHSLRFSEGYPAYPRNAIRSSFFEFNILNYIPFVKKRLYTNRNVLKYAPYGGLFISNSLLKKIGFPIKDMYLYVDDTEYTWRISQSGGKIILVEDSVVIDIDKNWGVNYPAPRSVTQLLLEEPFFRGFYTIRNHAFFDRNIWNNNMVLYIMNKFIFLTILLILSIRYRRIARFFEVISSISQGESGVLGEKLKK